MKWISVDEKLPDKCTEYIVCDEDRDVFVLIYRIKEESWSFDCDRNGYYDLYEGSKITHWMPLPEPPEN